MPPPPTATPGSALAPAVVPSEWLISSTSFTESRLLERSVALYDKPLSEFVEQQRVKVLHVLLH